MVDITHKNSTLRKAVATAKVRTSSLETIAALEQRRVPKGDVFEFARAAGLLGIKKTSDVIPDCHPLPIEFASITYTISDLDIVIRVEVHTIYKTGVEVEAMHGASVAALVMYDMLKPIDKGVVIEQVRLEQKSGGKSDLKPASLALKVAVVVCSDRVSRGEKQDTAGKFIVSALSKYQLECAAYEIVADEVEQIQAMALRFVDREFDMVILTGGTGLSARDVTPEAIKPLIDREIQGLMESARGYGQQRTPYAMLSRGVAGFIKQTLVMTFPGSANAVREYMDSLFPAILHVFALNNGDPH
ncbi:bifunctional molybdenum cofactor biosynthesis protein MoaC/MoaB [Pedobacter sp. SAFR-022]|uniref:bifunctional molybdenum cofactor biosynthesis protein MoaC/MoaB n=1 Tax=Pedobacter sp. SAFR-022 TaxID=3436861 RepID=UPI003F7D149F